jgi:hypothetical protein
VQGEEGSACNISDAETSFDLSIYESAFDALDQTVEDLSQNEARLPLYPYFLYDTEQNIDLDNWDCTWALLGEYTLTASLYRRPTDLDIGLLIQFQFLGNFTKSTGFIESFQCGSPERRLSVSLPPAKPCTPKNSSLQERVHEPVASSWVETIQAALTDNVGETCFDENVRALMPKTHEIVAQIRDFTINKSRRTIVSMTWSSLVEATCYEFFHPIHMQKYLGLFWSCWYPNWPTIHRPTFDAREKSSSLIAAMVVVGACLSPDERERDIAFTWFNTIEEMVFDDDLFSQEHLHMAWQKPGYSELRKSHLDILQAAYCVCLFQTWEGRKQSRKRALRHKFNALVYVSPFLWCLHPGV